MNVILKCRHVVKLRFSAYVVQVFHQFRGNTAFHTENLDGIKFPK